LVTGSNEQTANCKLQILITMSVRKIRPITPSQRHMIVDSYEDITAGKPEKSLTESIQRSGGRNNSGKMTMRYIGGGHKKRYRLVDFKRDNHGVAGTVKTIEYVPYCAGLFHKR
jgi:large subunit ribosomal protein L2